MLSVLDVVLIKDLYLKKGFVNVEMDMVKLQECHKSRAYKFVEMDVFFRINVMIIILSVGMVALQVAILRINICAVEDLNFQ